MGALSKLEIYGIAIALLAIAIFAGGAYEHHVGYVAGQKNIQTKFDAFVNDTKAAGLQAQKDNLEKERLYATQITTANVERSDALKRLSVTQANSNRRASADNPSAAAGSKAVCISSDAYNSAFQQFGKQLDGFIQDARKLIGEGDAAQIDAQTLLKAWPSAKSP